MLDSGKMVGFVITTDYDKAREFYEQRLGLHFVSVDQFALVMKSGGNTIRISKAANFTPLQGTVLGWEVQKIEGMVSWLKERGVVFEKYTFVEDAEGIWTAPSGDKVAWFKDPDGNVLSVSEHMEA
jgi:catechol 2,3-dioxygenase-like lactoylglutathione lyase family enzyme